MKKNIYIMYTISLLQGMVFYGSIATLYRQANGLSIFQITLIEGISLLLTLLFEFPWGIIADKIGYRNTLLVCNILYFISKIVFWLAGGKGIRKTRTVSYPRRLYYFKGIFLQPPNAISGLFRCLYLTVKYLF